MEGRLSKARGPPLKLPLSGPREGKKSRAQWWEKGQQAPLTCVGAEFSVSSGAGASLPALLGQQLADATLRGFSASRTARANFLQ